MSGSIKKLISKYGYTLVELLVVLALFAIILSIGMPNIKVIFKTRERVELAQFKRDIIFARNSAIVENCNYNLYLYPDENRYQIIKISKNITTIKDITLSNGVLIKGNNFNNSVTFSPTGAPNKAGTIFLTNKKQQNIELTIEVATGKVNLYYNR